MIRLSTPAPALHSAALHSFHLSDNYTFILLQLCRRSRFCGRYIIINGPFVEYKTCTKSIESINFKFYLSPSSADEIPRVRLPEVIDPVTIHIKDRIAFRTLGIRCAIRNAHAFSHNPTVPVDFTDFSDDSLSNLDPRDDNLKYVATHNQSGMSFDFFLRSLLTIADTLKCLSRCSAAH